MATQNGLEPSTSSVTGWRSNQLSYWAISQSTHKQVPVYNTSFHRICQVFFRDFLDFFRVFEKKFFRPKTVPFRACVRPLKMAFNAYMGASFLFFIQFRQAPFRRLRVGMSEVFPRLVHRLNDQIEGNFSAVR